MTTEDIKKYTEYLTEDGIYEIGDVIVRLEIFLDRANIKNKIKSWKLVSNEYDKLKKLIQVTASEINDYYDIR